MFAFLFPRLRDNIQRISQLILIKFFRKFWLIFVLIIFWRNWSRFYVVLNLNLSLAHHDIICFLSHDVLWLCLYLILLNLPLLRLLIFITVLICNAPHYLFKLFLCFILTTSWWVILWSILSEVFRIKSRWNWDW